MQFNPKCPGGGHLAALTSDSASSAAAVAFLKTARMEDASLRWGARQSSAYSAFSNGSAFSKGSVDDVSADVGGDDISGAFTNGGKVLNPR